MSRFKTPLIAALAVVLVATSGVFAHTGSTGLFHTGHLNTATAITTLTASLTSAVLHLRNTGAGPALRAENTAGKPAAAFVVKDGTISPFTVSSGKVVTNLNADKVDGKNAADFLPKAGTAANSDKLDGVDSTGFLRSTGKAADSNLLDGQDSTAFQRRVGSACGAGSSISAVNADGTVTCEVDNDTTYTAGEGVTLTDNAFGANFTPSGGPNGTASTVARGNHFHTGSEYQNVVIAAKAGGDFTSVQAALDSITDASTTNPYLVWVGPGVYTEKVTMKPWVHIEGSGQDQTTITWTGDSQSPSSGTGAATLLGANNTELRFLSVKSEGAGQSYATAVYNANASPRLTNVTATASGGIYTYGMYNNSSSPTLTNVTATASGGTYISGVYNKDSSPTLTNVTVTASGGVDSYGLFNYYSSPTMTNVAVTASGGTGSNHGLHNYSSSPTIEHSKLKGSTRSIYSIGGSAKAANSQLDGPLFGGLSCFNNYDANFAAVTCP